MNTDKPSERRNRRYLKPVSKRASEMPRRLHVNDARTAATAGVVVGVAAVAAVASYEHACPGSGARRAPRGRWPAPGSEVSCQVQVVPLIANDVGLAWLLVQEPWKPSVVLEPGAMVPL
jgi:hypothetical protein